MHHQMVFPLDFRSELLRQLMPALQSGECVSLIGISGVGKSNFTRFMLRPDVQRHYWGENPPWIVMIDINGLVLAADAESYAVTELMIHRLIVEMENRAVAVPLLEQAADLHQRLTAQPSMELALRYLERICGMISRTLQSRLIFVFDQFEDVWRSLPSRFFLNLRYLRDQFKFGLMYCTITREPLGLLRDDLEAVEAFWELFSAHTLGLGMYNERDSRLMLRLLAERRTIERTQAADDRLISLSGGHSGLLRTLFWEVSTSLGAEWGLAELLERPAVRLECAKIWNSLSSGEQLGLRDAASGRLPDDLSPERALLELKGVLQGQPPRIFSSLLAAFIAQQALLMEGITVNPRTRQIWIDGIIQAYQLTPLAFKLLCYLAGRSGEVCTRDAIFQELYDEQAADKNDNRLDELLKRLRQGIGDNGDAQRHIKTWRGAGIQLLKGRLI